MIELDPAATAFIQRTADVLSSERMPRIGAEIFALLIVTGDPLSVDEITLALRASRAAVGTNLRLLEAAGIAVRTVRPGERSAVFALSEDPFGNVVESISSRFGALASVAADALSRGVSPADGELQRMRIFFQLVHENAVSFLGQWRSR